MCVATPVVLIISISATGSTRCLAEVRCASGVQKAIVQFISQFEEYFTKEIGNSNEIFLVDYRRDLLFLKYWMFSAVCNESRQYIKIK